MKMHWIEAVDYADFAENLTLREQLRLAATCHRLLGKGPSLFVSQGTINLSLRLDDDERRRVSDGFFQRILLHARGFQSVPQGLSTPRSGGVTAINLVKCSNLSNTSIFAIAANCPALTSLRTERSYMLTWLQ